MYRPLAFVVRKTSLSLSLAQHSLFQAVYSYLVVAAVVVMSYSQEKADEDVAEAYFQEVFQCELHSTEEYSCP